MRSLCLMMVLVSGAMALHRGAADEVDKRLAIPGGLIGEGLVGGLIGDGGLVGGLLGEGGLVGGLIGDGGGLVGGLIGDGGLVGGLGGVVGDLLSGLLSSGGGIVEELGDLAVFLVRLEEGAFKGVLDTALGLADGLLESVLGVLATVTKGLAGKTTQPEIYAEFKKHKLESLCPACDALPNPKHAQACNQYCREQNWSLK